MSDAAASAGPPGQLVAVHHQWRSLREQGDLQGALTLVSNTLDAAIMTMGADHPDVLALSGVLGNLHVELHQLAQARRVFEEALADGRQSPGPDHPTMLRIAVDLGRVADRLGNKHEARRNFTTVAQYGPAVLGPDDPGVRTALRYLADEGGLPPAQAPTTIPAPRPGAQAYDSPTGEMPYTNTMRVSGQIPSPQASPREPGVYAVGPPPKPETPTELAGGVLYGEEDEELEPYRGRRPWLVVGIVLLVLVIGALIGLAVVYFRATPSQVAASPSTSATSSVAASPSPSLGAPTGLSLRDNAGSVTLTWGDPSGGRATFIVLGGRATDAPRAFTQLPAGQIAYTVNGLNPQADYCFRVAAVYSVDNLVLSDQVCTARHPATPASPSRSAQ